MERKDVLVILKRIKANYNEFIVDDYTISEWYKELSDYALEDVMKKLEEHFRNEQYGKFPPKVYFLTKYLIKTKDKKDIDNFYVDCPLCQRRLKYIDFEEHFNRCSAVDYIVKANKQYYDKEINAEELYNVSEELFNRAYYNFCKRLYEEKKVKGEERQNVINVLRNCKIDS